MFTGLRTARKALKAAQELEEQVTAYGGAWNKELQQQRMLIQALREELDLLRAHHNKLRGKYYGDQTNAKEADEYQHLDSREARKAAAFKKAGIMPGKPVKLEN